MAVGRLLIQGTNPPIIAQQLLFCSSLGEHVSSQMWYETHKTVLCIWLYIVVTGPCKARFTCVCVLTFSGRQYSLSAVSPFGEGQRSTLTPVYISNSITFPFSIRSQFLHLLVLTTVFLFHHGSRNRGQRGNGSCFSSNNPPPPSRTRELNCLPKIRRSCHS